MMKYVIMSTINMTAIICVVFYRGCVPPPRTPLLSGVRSGYSSPPSSPSIPT